MPIPATIQNHDVLGLTRRINRFVTELVKSVSSGVSEMTAHDLTRLRGYLSALRAYKAWVVSQPLLDMPETHPTDLPVPDPPDMPAVENESVADIIVLMSRLRDELLASQSARYASTLIGFDATRFDAIVLKIEKFLDDFVTVATPLDLPESSAASPLTGAGL